MAERVNPLKYLGEASFADFNSVKVKVEEIDEHTKVYTYGMLTVVRDMLGAVSGESYYVQLCTKPPMFSLFDSEECAIEVAQIPLLETLCPELGVAKSLSVWRAERDRLKTLIARATAQTKPVLEEIYARVWPPMNLV